MGPDGVPSAFPDFGTSRDHEKNAEGGPLRNQYTATLWDTKGDDPAAVHSVVALNEDEARNILTAYYTDELGLQLPHFSQWTLEIDVSGIADTVSRIVS